MTAESNSRQTRLSEVRAAQYGITMFMRTGTVIDVKSDNTFQKLGARVVSLGY